MNVWKIGSRWNEYGNPNASILDVFRRNQIVFVGDNCKFKLKEQVKKNDIIAIADGIKIISIAIVVDETAIQLTKENCSKYVHIEPWDKFSNSDFYNAIARKVHIFDLSTPITYVRTPTFCSVNASQIRHDLEKAYEENQQKKFDIKTAVYRILGTRDDDTKVSLLGAPKSSYIIPIYQRPYSWGEKQIERFISDVFRGYWGDGEEKEVVKVPIFIGNMQLSAKNHISNDEWKQDVIDGQQRITTILLILKYIQLSYPTIFSSTVHNLKFNFLHTHVMDEEQKLQYIESIQDISILDNSEANNNLYYSNLLVVKNIFITTLEENKKVGFDPSSFLDYILNDIYFVVVETDATLSETINIFNTINTAGMDLNSGDLFKLRMSEYMVSKNQVASIDEAFLQVDKIYKKIENLNVEKKKDYTILTILSNYQDFIIAKYKLSRRLYRLGVDRFFEELFDGLLYIKIWENFSKTSLEKVVLNLRDLEEFIDIQYKWDTTNPRTVEEMFARNIIPTTRYSEYQNLAYLILKYFPHNYDFAYKYIITISKLFIINSLYYDRQVNFMRTFMYNLRDKIVDKKFDEIINDIKKEISTSHKDKLYSSKQIKSEVISNIANSSMRKNLLCRISEYLAEKKRGISLDQMRELLFKKDFDIEHIHANADSTIIVDTSLQNSIGNLTMLERDMNRSIQNDVYTKKKESYKNSAYYSVKNILEEYTEWTADEIEDRRNKERDRIIEFLFSAKSI